MPDLLQKDAPRSAPGSAVERRDASMSFGDIRSIVYQALVTHLGAGATDDDGDVDIWVDDLSTDWVVWYSYSTHTPGPGYWRLAYSMDAANVVTFTGEPEAVVEVTSYIPAEAKAATVPAAPRNATVVDRSGRPEVTGEARAEVRKALRNVRETRRAPGEFEFREVANGTGGTDGVFTGYASVTGQPYEMEDWLGPWTEEVTVGAFRKTLAEGADVAFLVNHEGMTLARTKPGTLVLSEVSSGDVTGLHSEARLDMANPWSAALRSAVERGDIDEMSFAFRVTRQEWNEDYSERWINEVNLDKGDVSAVNYGANPHTAGLVAMRSKTARGVDWRGFLAGLGELRAGKTLSADTIATLQQVLDLISAADDAVDEAQPLLAELMGVPNPDAGDDDKGGADAASADDTDQLAAKVALEMLSLPNHIYDARARLAALRG